MNSDERDGPDALKRRDPAGNDAAGSYTGRRRQEQEGGNSPALHVGVERTWIRTRRHFLSCLRHPLPGRKPLSAKQAQVRRSQRRPLRSALPVRLAFKLVGCLAVLGPNRTRSLSPSVSGSKALTLIDKPDDRERQPVWHFERAGSCARRSRRVRVRRRSATRRLAPLFPLKRTFSLPLLYSTQRPIPTRLQKLSSSSRDPGTSNCSARCSTQVAQTYRQSSLHHLASPPSFANLPTFSNHPQDLLSIPVQP